MGDIIKKKDNDKKFVFECPICGTIFTEKERNIEKYVDNELEIGIFSFSYKVRCPNCELNSSYEKLELYDKNKDYE
jgi:transcription elongation factor Elf1